MGFFVVNKITYIDSTFNIIYLFLCNTFCWRTWSFSNRRGYNVKIWTEVILKSTRNGFFWTVVKYYPLHRCKVWKRSVKSFLFKSAWKQSNRLYIRSSVRCLNRFLSGCRESESIYKDRNITTVHIRFKIYGMKKIVITLIWRKFLIELKLEKLSRRKRVIVLFGSRPFQKKALGM